MTQRPKPANPETFEGRPIVCNCAKCIWQRAVKAQADLTPAPVVCPECGVIDCGTCDDCEAPACLCEHCDECGLLLEGECTCRCECGNPKDQDDRYCRQCHEEIRADIAYDEWKDRQLEGDQ